MAQPVTTGRERTVYLHFPTLDQLLTEAALAAAGDLLEPVFTGAAGRRGAATGGWSGSSARWSPSPARRAPGAVDSPRRA